MLQYIFRSSKDQLLKSDLLRHNLIAHILDGAIFVFAMSFVSVQTVLPVFLRAVGGGSVAIGSVPILWTIGINLPQILFLRFTHRSGRIKHILLRYGLLHRYLFLGLGLCTFFIVGRVDASVTILLILTLLFLTALSGSLGMPPWLQMFVKTTPVHFRGRLIAIRQLIGSLLGVLGGALVSVILTQFSLPLNFSLLFFIAFGFSMVSYVFLRSLKEPITEGENEFNIASENILQRCKIILRADSNFRNFLITDALLLMSMTAFVFYAVYALNKFSLPTSSAGMFTMIMMGSMVLANVIFGFLADSFGHKLNLLFLAAATGFASLLAVLSTNIVFFSLVFFFMGCALTIQGISRMPFVAELCRDQDRPFYVAMSNTLTAPAVFIGIIAGVLIEYFGYAPILLSYSTFAFIGLYWLVRYVREPRLQVAKS